jgi:hypothetical protein
VLRFGKRKTRCFTAAGFFMFQGFPPSVGCDIAPFMTPLNKGWLLRLTDS